MKRFNHILLLFLLLTTHYAWLHAQPDLQGPVPADPAVRTGKLNNGLTYYIRHNAKPEKKAELRLVVHAGALQEDADQHGLAHFMEHMAFNGTRHYPKNELVSFLESMGLAFGADINAGTGYTSTEYILPIPAQHLDKGLLVLEDWAHGVLLTPEEVEKERKVIVEEIKSHNTATQRMEVNTYKVLYGKPKGNSWNLGGSEQSIREFKQEALQRFYQDWYRPDLMAVIVVGDVDVDVVESKIRQQFSTIISPGQKREKDQYELTQHQQPRFSIQTDKQLEFPSLDIYNKLPQEPVTTLADKRRQLLRELYLGMFRERLEELQQQPETPLSFVYNHYYNALLPGQKIYMTSAVVNEKLVGKAIARLLQLRKQVQQYGFTQAELDRQKKQLLLRFEKQYTEKEKTESRQYVEKYVTHFLEGEPIPDAAFEYNFAKKQLLAISLPEIKAIAAQMLTDKNMVISLQMPQKEGLSVPAEEDLRRIVAEVAAMKVEPYREKIVANTLMTKKPKPGKTVSESFDAKLKVTTLILGNGVKVLLKATDFKDDEILLSASSPGGDSKASNHLRWTYRLAPRIVMEAGVNGFSKTALQKFLTGKSVKLSPYIGSLFEGFRGQCSPVDLETMLQLVHLYFTSPNKNEAAFKAFVAQNKPIYENLFANPEYFFDDQSTRIKYNHHPRIGYPRTEDFDRLQFGQVYAAYQDRFADASDFTFVLVGNIEPKKAKPLLEMYLGSLPALQRQEAWQDRGIRRATGRVEKQLNKGIEAKSKVEMYFSGSWNYSPFEAVLLQALADILTMRIIEVVREENGDAYSPYVNIDIQKYPVAEYGLSVNVATSPDKVDNVVKTVSKLVDELRAGGIPRQYLDKVKEKTRVLHQTRLKENEFWLDRMDQSVQEQVSLEALIATAQHAEEITAADLQCAAQQYLNSKNIIQIVMNPEATR